eukprot:232983-Pyramimonas_sp.AAC.1
MLGRGTLTWKSTMRIFFHNRPVVSRNSRLGSVIRLFGLWPKSHVGTASFNGGELAQPALCPFGA